VSVSYRCWAEVDLDALRNNLMVLRQLAGPSVQVMTVVKADAYGHGLRQTAGLLMQSGTDIFGVANLSEAKNIRKVGRGWPILMLGACLPDEIESAIKDDVMLTISSLEEARRISEIGKKLKKKALVHLKVDTGMSRLGCRPDQLADLVSGIPSFRWVDWVGLFSHFASIDSDPRFCRTQRQRFEKALASVRAAGIPLKYIHLHNSGGVIWEPHEDVNLVRPGSLVYGIIPPSPREAPNGLFEKLVPALSWKCRVGLVKQIAKGASVSYGRTFMAEHPMKVAILTAGYGDGYMRQGSSRSHVLIQGKRCPVLGRVTMDQIIVDVSGISEPTVGEEAILIGSQGDDRIHVHELARWCNTIPLEILTNITYRVPRLYRGAGAS